MEIVQLHKYISLNKMANGTVEVLFSGQPCMSVSGTHMMDFNELGESISVPNYRWKLNPVFAKLTYGANIFEDIPFCIQTSNTLEESVADGLVKLFDLGAFRTMIDLPEDTYSVTAFNDPTIHTDSEATDQITESKLAVNDEDQYVIDKDGNVVAHLGSGSYDEAQEIAAKTPGHIAVSGIQIRLKGLGTGSKFTQDDIRKQVKPSVTECKLSAIESFQLLENIVSGFMGTYRKEFNIPQEVVSEITTKLISESALTPQEKATLYMSLALGQTHFVNEETGKPLTKKHTVKPSKRDNENDDEKIAGKKSLADVFSMWSKKLDEQRRGNEFTANLQLSDNPKSQDANVKRSFYLKSPSGDRLSSHDSEHDAIGAFKKLKSTYGVKIMKEDTHEELSSEQFAIYEKELTDSEKKEKEAILSALKKDKNFMTKYGKDAEVGVTEDVVTERINMPQGHKETPDPISDDSAEGAGAKKKMMGNKAPVEVIAKILSGK